MTEKYSCIRTWVVGIKTCRVEPSCSFVPLTFFFFKILHALACVDLNNFAGTVIRDEMGLSLEKVGKEVLGSAIKVVITKGSTLIVTDGSTRKAVEGRVSQIRRLVEVQLLSLAAVYFLLWSSYCRVNCKIKWSHMHTSALLMCRRNYKLLAFSKSTKYNGFLFCRTLKKNFKKRYWMRE